MSTDIYEKFVMIPLAEYQQLLRTAGHENRHPESRQHKHYGGGDKGYSPTVPPGLPDKVMNRVQEDNDSSSVDEDDIKAIAADSSLGKSWKSVWEPL